MTAASHLIDAFLEMMSAERGAAANTLAAYRRDLGDYLGFLAEQGKTPDSAMREEIVGWLDGLKAEGLAASSAARKLSANRLSLDIGVPSGRITDILNFRRAITADTAVRLGRYFGNSAQFWLDLQSQYDIGVVEREKGAEIAKRVRPADAA